MWNGASVTRLTWMQGGCYILPVLKNLSLQAAAVNEGAIGKITTILGIGQ